MTSRHPAVSCACPKCQSERRTTPPPTPATDEPWEGPLTDKENAMLEAAWQKHKDAAPPTPAAEEREAVALAMLNGKRVREGWPVTAAIPEGFVDGDEWRLEAQDALSALAPIRAAEILAAEANERARIEADLKDPQIVHMNMLRGGIAKINVTQAMHLNGWTSIDNWHRMTVEQIEAAVEARNKHGAGK